MELFLADLAPQERYKLMNAIVVPRPIAWITTRSPSGLVNLAPFSAFTIVSYEPPLLGVNMGRRVNGERKDTARNVIDTGEYVVNIATEDMIDLIQKSSAPHPPEVSEVEVLGLPLLPSVDVNVPRLANAPLSMECRLHQVARFGSSDGEFVVGEVIRLHSREGLVNDCKIDSEALRPAMRLAGLAYGSLGNVTTYKP
jgi:flavin reductase (DIM6/NTAB) family NADH-FMN oxidoreductase RutF